MMKFHAQVNSAADGSFQASAVEQPEIVVGGLSPQCALDRLRDELRYRMEYCPCSSVDDDFIELELLSS